MGVGRRDSIISLHDRVKDSTFSPVVDYRCAYHPGEGRADALTILSGSMVPGGESIGEITHRRGSDPKCLGKLPLGKVAMAGNFSVRKSFDQQCNLHSNLSFKRAVG